MRTGFSSHEVSPVIDLCENCPIAKLLGEAPEGYSATVYRQKRDSEVFIVNNSTGAAVREFVSNSNWASQRSPRSSFNMCGQPTIKKRIIRPDEVVCGAVTEMKRVRLNYLMAEARQARGR